MKIKIAILLFLTSNLYAGAVEWNGQQVDYSDEFSFKSFGGKSGISIQPGTTAYASFFSSEEPGTRVFDMGMVGVTFIECAMDNVLMPAGNIIKNAYRSMPVQYRVQNDGEDWVLDKDGIPKEPVNRESFDILGLSLDPKDIPAEQMLEPITSKTRRENIEQKESQIRIFKESLE